MKLKLIMLVTNTNKRCRICGRSNITLSQITFDIHLPIGSGTKWICKADYLAALNSQVHYFSCITADSNTTKPEQLHFPQIIMHYLKHQ